MTAEKIAPPPKIIGVLVTFRRPEALAASLSRLASQTRPVDLLITVDNGPPRDAEQAVRLYEEKGHRACYISSGTNLGFAGGVALGMREALQHVGPRDWVLVLDDDDPPPTDTSIAEIEVFAHAMVAQDPRTGGVGLVGGRFDLRRGRIVRIQNEELGDPVLVDFVAGGHLGMYRAAAIQQTGTFSEDIFFALSEVEYGLRLRRDGWRLYADGATWGERRGRAGRLSHKGKPSYLVGVPDWRRYYSLRNAIYIQREHGLHLSAITAGLVRGIAKPLVNVLIGRPGALRHLNMGVRATMDGWRGRMGLRLKPTPASRPPRKGKPPKDQAQRASQNGIPSEQR